MKQFIFIIFVFALFSCSKDNLELNIDKNAQVYHYDYPNYYGNNILKFGIQLQIMDFNDISSKEDLEKYIVYYDAGIIENGKLSLTYNAIDEKYCENIKEEWFLPKNIIITNPETRIKFLFNSDIDVFDTDNKRIGFLRFGDHSCEGRANIYFIYATQETKIYGKNNSDNYNLKLKNGWNIIYEYDYKIFFWSKTMITTDGKAFPKGEKWIIIEAI
jgi:hypothetical protein